MPSTLLDKLCGRLQILDRISQSPSLRSADAFSEAMTGNASALCRLPVSRLESDIYWIIAKVAISRRLDFPTTKFQIFCAVWATVNTEHFMCYICRTESTSIFGPNEVIYRAIWHHLSFLPYQFSIFDDGGGGKGLTALHFLGRVFCSVVYWI